MNSQYPELEEAEHTRVAVNRLFTSEEAWQEEQVLAAKPTDTVLRAQLLFHHFKQSGPQSPSNEDRIKHLKWFIENRPDWQLCGSQPFTSNLDEANYQILKALWLTKIDESPDLMRRVPEDKTKCIGLRLRRQTSDTAGG